RRRRCGPRPGGLSLPRTRVRAVPGRRDWTREDLAAGVREGDRRALARAISLVEDGDPLAYGVVADLYPQTGSTYSVGVTGPPGRQDHAQRGALDPRPRSISKGRGP